MKRLNQVPILVIGACVSVWLSCGSSGEDDRNGSGDNTQQTPPGIVGQGGLTEVKGRLVLGGGAEPANGYQVWKVDHTAGDFARQSLDSAGNFSWPLDSFTVDSIYSFYVVGPELQGFGSVDFAPSTVGVQSSVIYRGGLGFDLGELVVALATSGKGDPDRSLFESQLAGGFSLEVNSSQAFEDLAFDSGLEVLGIGRDFTILDPLTLLHGVYLRDESAPLTAAVQREGNRLRFLATYNPNQIANVFVAEAGSWLSSTRQASYSSGSLASAKLWSLNHNTISEVSSGKREVYVFPPEVLPAQTIVFFAVWNKSGGVQNIPVLLAPSYSVPPLLEGISLDGEEIVAIDYSAEQPNGVTVPFCLGAQGVSMRVTPPKDHTGTPITGESHPFIDVEIEHFSAGELLSVSAIDYSAPLDEPYVFDFKNGYSLMWDPAAGTVRYTLAESVYDASSHDLSLWLDFLLEKAGEMDVSKIRLKIVFSNANGLDKSSVPLWLKRNC